MLTEHWLLYAILIGNPLGSALNFGLVSPCALKFENRTGTVALERRGRGNGLSAARDHAE